MGQAGDRGRGQEDRHLRHFHPPDEECCTLFAPKHPVTRARLEVVLETEARLPAEDLLALALKEREVLTYAWPGKPLPKGPEGAFIMEHGPA